jgi:hypothetical protein
MVNALRAFILGQPVGSYAWHSVVWALALLVVFVPLSVVLYQRKAAG